MKFISNYKMSFLFFMSGILCLIAYNIKGSSIDENGFLVESFGFIPIFWLFELMASLTFAFTFIKLKKKSAKVKAREELFLTDNFALRFAMQLLASN